LWPDSAEATAHDSNLAENSEYQSVKTEQEISEGRIPELEDKLARAGDRSCEALTRTIPWRATRALGAGGLSLDY
jgi:hypothetical protein